MEAVIIEKYFTPRLNELCKVLIDGGPSQDEVALLCVLSIMDETLRALMETEHNELVMQTYTEIETYIEKEGLGH